MLWFLLLSAVSSFTLKDHRRVRVTLHDGTPPWVEKQFLDHDRHRNKFTSWSVRDRFSNEVNALRALDKTDVAPRLLWANASTFTLGMTYVGKKSRPRNRQELMRILRELRRHGIYHEDLEARRDARLAEAEKEFDERVRVMNGDGTT